MFSLKLHPNAPKIADFQFVGFSVDNNPKFTASFIDKSMINGVDYDVELYVTQENGNCPIADEFSVLFGANAAQLVMFGSTQVPTVVNSGFCLNAYFLIRDVATNQIVSSARANASNI